VTYACAHAHARATQRQTHAQRPHRRSPTPTRTLSLCCCQIKAWKAGHKGECAAGTSGRATAAKPTADQMRVLEILEQLAGAADWRGVAAQERAARAVAAVVRTSMQDYASFVYCTLGNAYQSQGGVSKAIEYHTQDLAIAKEVGNRAGEGRAYGNLGISYQSQGDYAKAIEYHTQCLAIAKEVGDRAGEGGAYGTSATRIGRRGTSARPSRTRRSAWRMQRRWATGRERARRTGTSGACISRWGTIGIAYWSQRDLSKAIEYLTQQLAIAKEVGDRAGEGKAHGSLGILYQSQGGVDDPLKQ
jgi:tetratricopeptide (TPR) repeat protein